MHNINAQTEMHMQESNTHTESFPGSHVSLLCKWPQADTYHSHFLRFHVSPRTEQHLQADSFIQTATAVAKIQIAGGGLEIERRQVAAREERRTIDEGQTTVGDRLQPPHQCLMQRGKRKGAETRAETLTREEVKPESSGRRETSEMSEVCDKRQSEVPLL